FNVFKPVAETDLLNVDIVVEEMQFVDKLYHLVAVGFERIPEDIRQLGNYFPSMFLDCPDRRVDGVQCIEQEVGIDLRLEQGDLHFAVLHRELALLLRLILETLEVPDYVVYPDRYDVLIVEVKALPFQKTQKMILPVVEVNVPFH